MSPSLEQAPTTDRLAAAETLVGRPEAIRPRTAVPTDTRPKPFATAGWLAMGMLLIGLVAAGVLLTVIGLKDDLKQRKRSYRRRSRRVVERTPLSANETRA